MVLGCNILTCAEGADSPRTSQIPHPWNPETIREPISVLQEFVSIRGLVSCGLEPTKQKTFASSLKYSQMGSDILGRTPLGGKYNRVGECDCCLWSQEGIKDGLLN